jgi:peptide-methionine (S)-S-oxide reductase
MTPTPTTIQAYDRDTPSRDETETATFGLGCFWGPDARFGAMDGVIRTRVGYAGGTKANPTYHDLGDHTEVLQVDYLPEELPYSDLLDRVFRSHNPSRQTPTIQYQNIVLVSTSTQIDALKSYLTANDLSVDGIETRVERLSGFTLAESYHQKHSLKSRQSLVNTFNDAGYDDEDLRESPAAAKLNGYVAGRELSERHDLGTSTNRTVHGQ